MLHLDIYHVYIRLVLNFVLPLFHIQMTNGNQINGRANWTYDENVNNLFFFFYILLSLQIWWKGIVCCVLFVERDGPVKKKAEHRKWMCRMSRGEPKYHFLPSKFHKLHTFHFLYTRIRVSTLQHSAGYAWYACVVCANASSISQQ